MCTSFPALHLAPSVWKLEIGLGNRQKRQITVCSWLQISGLPLQIRSLLVAQTVKNPPAMQETWVCSQGWEDLLEKEKATHSSILAWRIPWTEQPGGLPSTGLQRLRHNWATFTLRKSVSRFLIASYQHGTHPPYSAFYHVSEQCRSNSLTLCRGTCQ